jgi:hypothetical protein
LTEQGGAVERPVFLQQVQPIIGRITQTECDLVHTRVDFSAPDPFEVPDFAIRHMIAPLTEVAVGTILEVIKIVCFSPFAHIRIKMSRGA